jgi:hypothetical protein
MSELAAAGKTWQHRSDFFGLFEQQSSAQDEAAWLHLQHSVFLQQDVSS